MKKILVALMLGLSCFTAVADRCLVVVDEYAFKMSVRVPRTYDNMESLGYRKYQTQSIQGTMLIKYMNGERPEIVVTNLVNKTHKINKENITYTCEVDTWGDVGPMTRVNLIGNNKKCKFETPSVVFYMDAEPSYNVGEDDEDNSLLITLAGTGSTGNSSKYGVRLIKSLNGYLTGTLGCGCKAYGHVSPTRIAGRCGATSEVDDVASVFGSWNAKFKSRYAKYVEVPSQSPTSDDDLWAQQGYCD